MIGRQIGFYLTPKDEKRFLEEIQKKGDVLSSNKNITIEQSEPLYLNEKSIEQVLIKSPASKIYFSSSGFVDDNNSDVIVYSRSVSELFFTPATKQELTFESYRSSITKNTYFSYKGKLVRGIDLTEEDLRDKFNQRKEKILNRDKRVLDSGRLWVAMRYLEGQEFIDKDKWFKRWYESYTKWIKKNCRLSKDKSYYIGEDTYRAYKEGKYIINGVDWE